MKFCTKCGTQCEDNATACTNCGAAMAAPAGVTDHTSEFDAKDVSENKVVAMLPYLLGVMGLIVAILLANTSEYVRFHVRNALKFTVVSTLLGFCNIVPILGTIVFVVGILVVFVLRIIAFFQVCKGQAKEPALISKLTFLK